MVVKQQVKLKLTIGYYEKKVLCGQVPGKACDILLERPEQINHKTIQESRTNKITFTYNKNNYVLSSLSSLQVVKNQEQTKQKTRIERKICLALQKLRKIQSRREKKIVSKDVYFFPLFDKNYTTFRSQYFLNYSLKNFVLLKYCINLPINLFGVYFRQVFDPEEETYVLDKNKIVDWNQSFRFEDRSFQEGGDDGNHPTTNTYKIKRMKIESLFVDILANMGLIGILFIFCRPNKEDNSKLKECIKHIQEDLQAIQTLIRALVKTTQGDCTLTNFSGDKSTSFWGQTLV